MASDLELARRAAAGEGEAFRLLLERHYDALYRLAYRFLGRAGDAEDLAQEICLGLPRKLKSFRGDSRFSTWLYRVAVNAGLDHARRKKSIRELEATYVAVSEQRTADWADSEARTRWLYEALDALGSPLKETALLVLAEDLSHREAAEVLGITENTVSWRMHEVRKRLKARADSDHER